MPLPPSRETPENETVDTRPSSGIDFVSMANQLPLPDQIGQPFTQGQTRSFSGSGLFGNSANVSRFETIPPDAPTQRDAAFQVLTRLVQAEELSPWNTATIRNNVRLLVDAPQAAYILGNANIIDDWQSTIWSHTMASMGSEIGDIAQTEINNPDIINAGFVADFFKAHDKDFSSDERKFVANLLAAMPDTNVILANANVRKEGDSWWDNFKFGWRVLTRAPEAIRPGVNDPRRQLITEMHEWLKAHEFETIEDRAEFMMFFYERAASSIKDVEANASGFFALTEASVAMPFTVFGNEYNDWINRSADPDHFASRENLSIGQNIAIGMGVNPGDDWYTTTSGLFDGVIGIVGDPQNLAFGVGNGIRNAARVPRAVSATKVDAFKDAFRLFGGGRRMNLPVFDRGIISRFAYATFSRSVDEIVETPKVNRLVSRLSRMTSESDIVDLMPSWKESEKLVRWVSQTTDENVIRELLRAGMKHPEAIADDAPLLAARTQAELANAIQRHKDNLDSFLKTDGSLQNMSDLDEVQDILVLPQRITPRIDEGSDPTEVDEVSRFNALRRGRDFLESIDDLEETGLEAFPLTGETTVKLKDGRVANVVYGRSGQGTPFSVATINGEIVASRVGQLAGTADGYEGNGLYSALLRVQRDRLGLTVDEFMEGEGAISADAARIANRVFGEDAGIFIRSSELTGDGAEKYAVTTLGVSSKPPLNLDDVLDELGLYLDASGFNDEAVELVGGASLSDLSAEAQNQVRRFVQAKGHDFAGFGGEMIVTDEGRNMLLRGRDIAGSGRNSFDELRDSYQAMVEAKLRYNDIHTKMQPRLWVVKDTGLELPSRTRQVRRALSSGSNSAFMRQLRRSGFRVTHRLPSNITLTETGEGAQQLRNWIKALGGTDELANKWSDAFRAGNAATRKDTILEALSEVGEEIKNPMLRDGILEFGNKQGQYTYFYDRAGRELGLSNDGTIVPLALAHFTDNFAMPDAKALLRSLKRYGQGKVLPGTRRGILPSTRKNRKFLAENLRAKMRRVHGVTGIADEDLYAMAYADILGGEYGRATGFGAVAKTASLFHSAYQMLHNVFVIAQLAFRPIAWASRVLMEETVRADLMSLPSMWRNPYDWAMQVADASAIRRLPRQIQAQGEIAEGLVNRLFLSGGLDANQARKLIPDLDDLLANADVSIDDTARVRAFISSYVGRELSGMGVTEGMLGARGNITRRAIKRERRLRNTFSKMDVDGMGPEFRWDIDGQEIAQRSFWSQFITEAEAATVPIEYTLGSMTPRGLQTYGRGYGRQIYQMNSDPIVSTYGYNRAIAAATGGQTKYTAENLVASSQWPKIKHIVDKKLAGDGLGEVMSEVEKADWYLRQVDEIVSTLFDPLANGDLAEKARILREIRHGGTTNIEVNGVRHTLNASEANYEGFVRSVAGLTESAYEEGRQLPQKIAAYLDPRFGQEVSENGFRRFTDWAMNVFGEQATQRLNRQPAYRHIRGRYYRYYRDLGWDVETARLAAAEKAAEQVNWIFFDNTTIPQFLKDMNEVVPFFSAMWEVGSTWLYKIPSANVLPVGYAQLGRRVERTLRGLRATGLVDYDPENNQMTLNISADMGNAKGPLASAFGKTLFQYTRLPVTLLEYIGGLGNLITDGEFDKSDFANWAKDGFSIGIGNPLDPTSHGLMAVNQFSIGFSPVLQLPVSMGANAVFAQSDERIDVEPQTSIGQFLIDNPDMDLGEILRANEEAFIEANGEELFKRALNADFDLDEIVMPESIRLPSTSTWEMLTNRLVFPFGKMETAGEVITAASPSAMNYVWRGLLQKFGGESGDEIAGMLFGQMAGYSMASEIITQIQMLEASEGAVTEILDLTAEAWEIVERLELEVQMDEDSAPIILAANSPEAERAQELFNKIHKKNAQLVKRANDNAAGSTIMRGVMGQLGPVTPRMWTKEQQAVASYWAARDLSKEAEATGSVNFGKLLTDSPGISSFNDLQRHAGLVQAWMNDSTGDEAKVWLAQNTPQLMPFTQGKSYWGPAGPPPEIELFDDWIDQVESGERKPFKPEVWMMRYQRTGVSIDREIAIINQYGTDPDRATQAILADYNAYRDVVDPYNMKYDSLEFLDAYLYDGAYADYRRTDLDDLAAYELVVEKKRNTREEIDTIQDLLQYGNLEPDEQRRLIGILNSHIREYDNAVEELNNLNLDDEYLNPRERVIDRYFDLSNQYYQERNELFDQLAQVEDKTARSIVFEAIRAKDDDWYNTQHTIEGHSGDRIAVPAPQVRSWNGKPQKEKQERLLSMVGKRPEWLTQFEAELLINESGKFADVLPSTPAERRIYDEAALRKWEIRQAWLADPSAITKSQRDKLIREVDDARDAALVEMGRGEEVAYMDMVPFMRLARSGMLPPSLQGVTPVLGQVLEELRMMEKSPRTNEGYERMMRLRRWLEGQYFLQNPTAKDDLLTIGSAMFGETLPSAVYAKLFQADFFNELA